LPGLQTDDKQTDPRLKRASEPSIQNETDKLNKFCTLNNLKEGMLGKLQILRSGKTRLLLGENDLLIDVGSNLSFRQVLIYTNIL
jgi:DNA-directed RNA polymerase III subunit RPC4